ncbi:MAG: GtrA family protein [Erythrobacter sp.]
MALVPSWERIRELVRFYQAAALNTAFGIGAYLVLVALGMNMYAAQALSHVMGMAFNYFTYSRHVFRGSAPAKLRFILSYSGHYLLGLGALYLMSRVTPNPYVAGIAAAVAVSVINYFVLRHLVFRAPSP